MGVTDTDQICVERKKRDLKPWAELVESVLVFYIIRDSIQSPILFLFVSFPLFLVFD